MQTEDYLLLGGIAIGAIFILRKDLGKPIQDVGRITGATADLTTDILKSPYVIAAGTNKIFLDIVAQDKAASKEISTIINKKSSAVDTTKTVYNVQKATTGAIIQKATTSTIIPYKKNIDYSKPSMATAATVLQNAQNKGILPNPNIVYTAAPTPAQKTAKVLGVLGKTYF